jgi:hypothetical protein
MTDQAAIVAEGRAALARIKDHSRRLFEDYLAIGAALLIGRSECLKLAGSNSLQTPAYRTHWRRWLDQHGFGDMEAGERIKTMWLAENKAEIIRWRDGLSEASRRCANHPGAIFAHMKAGTEPAPRGPKKKQPPHVVLRPCHPDSVDSSGYSKPINWPREDHIRRAAQAVGETYGSRDTYKIATAALKAALRHEGDVVELLQPAKAAPALELIA